jgi:subfamily B ATP-binding cassette protein MsbA
MLGRKRKPNQSFWRLATRLLAHRAMLAAALFFAVVSAAGLGFGLVGIVVVLNQIVPPEQGEVRVPFPEQVAQRAAELPAWAQPPASWIDALPSDPYHAVVLMVLVLGLLTVIGAVTNFLHLYCAITVVTTTIADIRREAYKAVLAGPLGGVRLGDPSETVSRIVQDANVLSRGFQALTSRAMAQITKGVASLAAALIIEWRLTLAIIIVGPLLGVIIRKLGKRIRRASRAAMKGRASLLGVATEALQGFRVVKVYSGEERELDRFEEHNRTVVKQELRARTAKALSTPISELIALGVIGILAVVAAKAILDGELDATSFLGALGALAYAGNSLKPLTNVVQDVQIADAAAQRIVRVIDAEPERATAGQRALPAHRRSLAFDDVRFTYPAKDEPALEGVTLEIPFGTTAAFVGPNGSGKTTLLSLVPALFTPDSGRVLLDGEDIFESDLASLRAQIGVVTQEVVLFRGSVYENIAYARPGATKADVEEALKRAHAWDFVEKLPGGLDADVGDRGLNLSGGQRQRLSIARAILRDPAILIMDEATSMIDAESEANIGEALAGFGRGRTVLIVAHRLATVVSADMIVVLDRGKIVDAGTHDELLARCDLYRSLAGGQLAVSGN